MKQEEKNVLGQELEFFESQREEFLKTYKDRFVLIKGKKLIGSYTTEEEAYQAGVEKFENTPFFIRKVTEKDESISLPALTAGVIHVGL